MYLEDLGLRERPFSSVPDPRFIYLGGSHERALAHLQRCVQAPGGVAHFIGASGAGKTTMCRIFMNRLPERVDVALILHPMPTSQEMLSVVCDELGITYGKDAPSLILGESLFRKQIAALGERRTVVIVDEAQSLSLDVLEQLYLLSSLEIDGRKLLGLILIGEPWLLDLLARAVPHQPPQSMGYNLLPLAEAETCAYVRHRIETAGGRRDIFEVDALREVHQLSGGVPGVINAICARALLSAVAQRRRSVDRSTVRAAGRSVLAPAGAPAIEVPDYVLRMEPVAVQKEKARSVASRARRPLWPWLVAGGLALNAAAIAGILFTPRSPELVPPWLARRDDVETPATGAPAALAVSPPEAQAAPTVDEPPRSVRPPDVSTPTAQPAVTTPPQPAPSTADYAAAPSNPGDESPRQRRRRERAEMRSIETPTQRDASQAPPSTEMALKIDMLVWAAEPRERMVYVNGHKYVEGQTLQNGAFLEHIEQDGIVVIREGRRLRLRSEAPWRVRGHFRPEIE